uniref:Putative secreted protein n=1 Tax=Ixodes scapularis TaxID=6945 RepID=A0A4D5RVR8_IXOSC
MFALWPAILASQPSVHCGAVHALPRLTDVRKRSYSIYKTKVCKGKILCVGVFLFNTAYFQCLCLSEFPPFPKNLMLCIALDTSFRLFIVYIYKGHTRNWQCKEYVVVPMRSQCLRKLSVLVI